MLVLTPLNWNTQSNIPFWTVDGAVDWIDLRSKRQKGLTGPLLNNGFAFAEFQRPIPAGSSLLAPTLTERLIEPLTTYEGLLGFSLSGPRIIVTPLDLLWETLLFRGDAENLDLHDPIRMTGDERVNIYFNDSLIKSEIAIVGSRAWQNNVNIFRREYRRKRLIIDNLPRQERPQRFRQLRRITGNEMRKFNLSDDEASLLLPPEHISDGFERPESEINEPFDTDGDLSIYPNWNEDVGDFDVIAGVCENSFTGRAHNLGSIDGGDHSVKATFTAPVTFTGLQGGLQARWQDDSNYILFSVQDRATARLMIQKVVGGVVSLIGTFVDESDDWIPGEELKGECDSDEFRLFRAGILKMTRTEPGLFTMETQGGMRGEGLSDFLWDDWQLKDLEIPTPPTTNLPKYGQIILKSSGLQYAQEIIDPDNNEPQYGQQIVVEPKPEYGQVIRKESDTEYGRRIVRD